MKIKDMIIKTSDETLFTVVDAGTDNIIVDCETRKHVLELALNDREIYELLDARVAHIKVGEVYGDIILEVVR